MVGAASLAIAVPAVALAAGTSQAQGATVINLNHHRVVYGGKVTVTGTTSTAAAGQRLELEFSQSGSTWSALASTTTGNGGSFVFRTRLRRSGLLRVAAGGPVATTASTLAPATSASTVIQPSASVPVTVESKLVVHDQRRNVLSGSTVTVGGRLLPGSAGNPVELQTASGGRWQTVAHAHTGASGRFALRFAPGGLGTERLRVRFAHTTAGSGRVTVYRQTVASWYNDGGGTACGFHAGMGVANKTLPCGTKVTFVYGGRRVTATVDDRGPFVAGREWDFNQNTAAALGMGGVATVWSSK
jgi:hypothetical protein